MLATQKNALINEEIQPVSTLQSPSTTMTWKDDQSLPLLLCSV